MRILININDYDEKSGSDTNDEFPSKKLFLWGVPKRPIVLNFVVEIFYNKKRHF